MRLKFGIRVTLPSGFIGTAIKILGKKHIEPHERRRNIRLIVS
jgi:hypothetical protein